MGDENVSRNCDYGNAFRLNAINLSGGLIGSAQNWSVGYYGNNSVHTVADPVNGSWSYGYDKFNRISTASCSGACPYGTSTQTLGPATAAQKSYNVGLRRLTQWRKFYGNRFEDRSAGSKSHQLRD